MITKPYLALALVALAACDDSASVEANLDAQASLSFALAGPQSLFGSRPPSDPLRISGHTITITRFELRASEMVLEGATVGQGELKDGSTVVTVPVSGALVTAITADIASGSYDSFKMAVRSVRMVGSYDGAPFDVTVRVDQDLDLRLSPPLTVRAVENGNVTVKLGIANWFRDADGSAIDPRNMSSSSESRLKSSIKASFEAFEDSDRNGI